MVFLDKEDEFLEGNLSPAFCGSGARKQLLLG
jgi:hypothetical protein